MSEDGDIWRAIHEDRRKKRWSNNRQSLALLRSLGSEYKTLNESVSHYRVGDFDFWPTTGKFYNQRTGQKGRGVRNLIRIVKINR